MSDETQTISLQDARTLVRRAFEACGVPPANAASVASALVAAEAEGQVGHGFSRIEDYAAQVRSGKVIALAKPVLTRPAPALIDIDAGFGFAYPALDLAIAEGVQTAQRLGCSTMAIRNSHHCGALSVQVDKIAREGLIGIMVANAPAAIAPWGAKTPIFGTNPIAFAAPRPDAPPLVVDLSLSRVARGKVMHAKKSGTEIPLGWALDASGEPTRDPDAALEGSMVPIGEAKGTALALVVEVLASALTGATSSREMSSFFTADGPPPGAGQFLMALKPADREGFSERLVSLLQAIEALEGARLPGGRREQELARSASAGLTIPRAYLDKTRALAGD